MENSSIIPEFLLSSRGMCPEFLSALPRESSYIQQFFSLTNFYLCLSSPLVKNPGSQQRQHIFPWLSPIAQNCYVHDLTKQAY